MPTAARDARPVPLPVADGPIVIGHRGACGYRPEHTLASYALAIELGADFIEPDLVSTRDGVLVARHENEIGGTTDVAAHPELAGRRTTKTVDGVPVTGWFTEDLTLAELRTLRAVERIPHVRPQCAQHDGRHLVPTFDEVLDLAERAGRARGRAVGVYAETKHPTYFDGIGLSLEEPLVAALRRCGHTSAASPVFLQSFEVGSLVELAALTPVRLTQLLAGPGEQPYDAVAAGSDLTYDAMGTPAGLARIASYAAGIGPAKERVVARRGDGTLGSPTPLVAQAHRVGLLVHAYTFRDENCFLPADLRVGADPGGRGSARAELEAFFAAGVDGVFADHPDTALAALHQRTAAAA